MATLEGQTIANSYKDLLQVSNANTGIDGTPRLVSDGQGTDSILYLSTDKVGVGGVPTSHLEIISAGTDSQTSLVISGYNDQIDKNPELVLRKSHSDTVGTVSATPNDTILGVIKFSGVDSSDGYDNGVTITAEQNGSASTLLPTDLKFATNSPTVVNTDQLVLHHDGGIAMGTDNPNGTLHVHTASAGSVNAPSVSNDLVVENNDNAGITILTPDDKMGTLGFGSPADSIAGMVRYDETNKSMIFGTVEDTSAGNIKFLTANEVTAMTIDSSQNSTFSGILKIDQNTTDAFALHIDSEATTTHNQYFEAPATTTGAVIRIDGAGGLTTGHLFNANITSTAMATTATDGAFKIVHSADSDTNTNNLMYLHNDHADSTGTTVLKLQQDSTGLALDTNGYIASQNVPNHVANTMSSPYYRFDGVNDYVEIADSDNLSFSKHLTISAWVRLNTDDPTTSNVIVGKYHTSDKREYLFLITSTNVLSFVNSDDGISNVTVSTPSGIPNLDKWNHFSATFDSGTVKLYVNGVLEATGSGDGTSIHNGVEPAYIGGNQGGVTNNLNGEIACVRLFNKVLTETEVKEQYSGASVPYKYKGANQTTLVTNGGFDSDTSDWDGQNATLSSESGGLSGNCLKVLQTSGSSAYASQDITTVIGKRYRFSFYVKQGNSVYGGHARVGTSQFGNEVSGDLNFTPTGSFVQHSIEFTATTTTVYIQVASGFTASTYQLYDTITCVPIGAVAEYDGSSAGAKVWGDKSGNGLHGTVGAGTLDATAPTLENTPYDAGTEYEEGTFTPTIVSSGGVTLTAGSGNTAQYVRVGNKVTCNGFVIVNGLNSADTSHTISLHGLPYAGRSGNRAAVAFGNNENMALTRGDNIQGIIYDTNSTISIYVNDGTGSNATNMYVSEWSDDGKTYFSVTYFV